MSHEVVRTRGGALAMRSLADGEVMHPGVGPRIEAEQLYVRQSRLEERLLAGDRSPPQPALVVLDVGLGAGSNALAARAASERAPEGAARLALFSFERDLGGFELALASGEAFGWQGEPGEAARALLARGEHQSARTGWRLVRGDALDALARWSVPADIIFWDPFSPRANPTLWTVAAFAAARRAAGPRCTLFTYSASTATRLAMLLGGWAVGVGDAIGDKRQTTAAAVVVDDLANPLHRSWLARLSRPDAPLPTDAPADFLARASAAPQFIRPSPPSPPSPLSSPSFLEPTHDAGVALFKRGIAGPVVMLNLLRFRATADYSASPELAPAVPISGAAAYQRYVEHTLPHLRRSGGDLVFLGKGGRFLIGRADERWDAAMLVRQHSVAAFIAFASDTEYLKGMGHRVAALEDSRLLPLVEEPLGRA